MESLTPQLSDLTTNIDTLTSALAPLLSQPLTASTSKQPLLDKAKTYILTVYALESLLFTALRLSGTDAKTHPIFAELQRVKEYFGKITAAEEMGAGGGTVRARVDKEAAGRFVKAGLAGNERFGRERREREGRERAGAKRKLEAMGTHTRFEEGVAKKSKAEEGESISVVRAQDLEEDGEEEEDSSAAEQKQKTKGKGSEGDDKDAIAALEETLVDSAPSGSAADGGKKKKKNKKKRAQ